MVPGKHKDPNVEEWKGELLISPQQLAVDSSTFTESLARVNTLGVTATIERPKAYKNAKMQYREADFWPSKDSEHYGTRSYTTPKFQLKVNFMFDNHSIVLNSKREVLLRKNTLKTSGITGLKRDDRGLPHMKGLLAGGSASSMGAKLLSGSGNLIAARIAGTAYAAAQPAGPDGVPPAVAEVHTAPGVSARYSQAGQSRVY